MRSIVMCLLFAAAFAGLAGCQKAGVPHSKSLDRSALIALTFPDVPAGQPVVAERVELPFAYDSKDKNKRESIRAEIEPLYVVRLDATHAVLVTQVTPIDQNAAAITCHACSMFVGAYFFTQDDIGWRLSARQDVVASGGLEGNLGATKIHRLEDSHYALTAQWGSCWQGYCGQWLALVDLKPDLAVGLAPDVALSADNDGAHGACSILDGKDQPLPDDKEHECMDVKGKWAFRGPQLVINFVGRVKDPEKPVVNIRQQVVYSIAGGRLMVTSGENPVPAF